MGGHVYSVCTHALECRILDQKKTLDPLELKQKAVVSYLMWVLGTDSSLKHVTLLGCGRTLAGRALS